MKEAGVPLVEPREVGALDALLKIDPPPGDALEEHIDWRLQVDHKIGLWRSDVELGVHLLVERVLRLIERHAREQPVLLKEIICDAHRRKQILLRKPGELLRPLEQKGELRGKRTDARVSVEALEKRVLRGLFQHELGRQGLCQALRKTRLADADRSFDNDETMRGRLRLHSCQIPSRLARAASSAARPRPGISSSGAMCASGRSTKLRSRIPGCDSSRLPPLARSVA